MLISGNKRLLPCCKKATWHSVQVQQGRLWSSCKPTFWPRKTSVDRYLRALRRLLGIANALGQKVARKTRAIVRCLQRFYLPSTKRVRMSSSTAISSRRKHTQSEDCRQSSQAIDDPIRLYLLQMGGIPLLNRDGEVQSARQNRALASPLSA